MVRFSLDSIFLAPSPQCGQIDIENARGFIQRLGCREHPADVHFLEFVQWNAIAHLDWGVLRREGGGQVFHSDAIGLAQDGGPLDHISQFADVAGPTVATQRSLGFGGESDDRARTPQLRKQTFSQARDIFAPLPQRRQIDLHDCDAIKQILAEFRGLHRFFKIHIGRGDQTHIGAPGLRIADALIFPVLNESQELGLQFQRQIANFIEEERAAVAGEDAAGVVADGSGEGAAGVAEEFAFEQLG